MLRNSGKSPAEAEAVGKEYVVAFHAEFLLEISVAVKNVSEKKLRRRNVDVAVFIAASRNIPFSVCYVLLQLFKLFRIILLKKLIAVSALKIETVVRICFKKAEVVIKCFWQTGVDDILKIPIPDCVKMCRCNGVNSFFVSHNYLPALLF